MSGITGSDHRQAYPADSNGNPLVLFVQFNLRELPENNLLPKTGLLQFFLLDDRYYGVPLQESGYPQNTYQVVYHEKVDESVTKEQVLALGIRDMQIFMNPHGDILCLDIPTLLRRTREARRVQNITIPYCSSLIRTVGMRSGVCCGAMQELVLFS